MYSINICVVDDCRDEATVLCDGLHLFGYHTVAAYSGGQALEICRKGNVQLVLLDIGLPDIDGHEICRQLKSDPLTMDIPVIFVTARGSSEDVALGYDLGAVDYVAKPYNLPIVIVQVEAALRTRQDFSGPVSGPYVLTDPIYTDQLTGLRNRRFLIERLQEEAEKAHRYRYPLSCLLFDFDESEAENSDDERDGIKDILVEMAMALRSSSRAFDILARYDDTQFAAILPHTHLPNAISYANKIRREITDVLKADARADSGADLCFGIVTCNDGKRAPSAEELLGETMRLLLLAKSGAPDRISARMFASA